jgi:basic membrane protein A and related proteins
MHIKENDNMFDFRKRAFVVGAAAVAALTIAACSKQEAPKPAPVAAAPAEAPKPAPLKIGFIYVGPVGDAGWTYAHDQGRKAIEKEFGDKVITKFVESVPEGADAERVLRDLAQEGNKLIFATSFGFMESMLKVAEGFKDARFEHATGYKTADNLRIYDSRTYEGAYMAGIIAGGMTKTGNLGVVASIPIPEVIRNINAFTLGAQTVNPNVKTRVVWVNKWFDPPKEAEGAQSLLNQGADVLFQNTDSTAVLQTAEKAGKYAFGWDSDMSKFGPKAHLGSAIINWGPYYTKAAREALDGSWKTGGAWWGVKEGAIDLVSVSDVIPAEIRKRVDDVREGLKSGAFSVWKGPIVDQTGKEMLAKDAVADDKWMHDVKWYVRGVEGKVPSGS